MTETKATEIRTLYPPIEPYETGYLRVSDVHDIYYELVGNPNGEQTAVVLHGGPGGGCQPHYRCYFDPKRYKVILFDQRGAGRSKPSAAETLVENTTWDLVDDIEKLRRHLKIDRWIVFGGSWGSTLALAYAQTYPEAVKGLILRGIFLCRRQELLWLYQDGPARRLFPDYWELFEAPIPEVERGDMISAYHRRLFGEDKEERLKCAKAWTQWEMAISKLIVDREVILRGEEDEFALKFARIENHYFVNGGFLKENDQLLKGAQVLRKHKIPGFIVHGRYDVVCPPQSAWDLHKAWPESELVFTISGHSMSEKDIMSELVKACDKFVDLK